MRILLINTPRSPHNGIREYANEETRRFIHKKLIGPPLGLLTLAAAIKDHEVIVWDTKAEYDLHPDAPPLAKMVLQLMDEHKPDIVGTTVITSEFYYGVEILRTVKKYDPQVLTVIGGLHAALCIEDFTDPAINVVCRGQAAHIFKAIVKAREKNLPLSSVPGAYLVTDSCPVKNKCELPEQNPAGSDYLMPDRSLLDRWRETYKVGGSPYPVTYLYTSLGCPYKCTFCSIWKEFDGVYMQREVESIIKELKELDFKIVRFSDANTIVNIKFIDRLFSRIEEEGIKKEFIMDIRSDTAVKYPWLIEKLARNGLKVVICGFESFRDEELKKYNKNAPARLIPQAIEIFHKN
ncbi:MAG: cobalamin-dependent protein, partial [Bacteroidetes bacterium]|nr:cobalamin-dependent protein [Bacteroidota bacterium]